MGIRFFCPNGHKLNVKEFQAGRKGICPFCGSKIQIPTQSTRRSSKEEKAAHHVAGGPEDAMHGAGAATALAPGDAFGGSSAAWPTSAPFPSGPAEAAPLGPSSFLSPAFPSAPVQPTSQPAPQLGGFPTSGAQPAPYQGAPLASAPMPAAPAPTPAPAAPAPATPSVSDPLSEAGDAVWYVRPPSGGQFGPAGRDVMRTWLAEGRISADALVWREGWRDWQPAPQVFTQLAAQGLQVFQGIGPVAASSGPMSAVGYRPAAKRQSKTTQMVVIGVLVVAVLVLLGVFVAILLGGGS